MELNRSKDWWLAKADREGGAVIAAGALAVDPPVDTAADTTRLAFGRFVSLMRRQRQMSVEQFAREADLDASELLAIEDDIHYIARPRSIYRLAQFFNVPQPRLMQLAGLTAANDPGLGVEAVRFAARSESVQKLTDEELAALEAFIAVLNDKGSSTSREESQS